MFGRGHWLRRASLLLALCAGAVGASAPTPAPGAAAWAADPDDQFLLDVNIRQLKLDEDVSLAARRARRAKLGMYAGPTDGPLPTESVAVYKPPRTRGRGRFL